MYFMWQYANIYFRMKKKYKIEKSASKKRHDWVQRLYELPTNFDDFIYANQIVSQKKTLKNKTALLICWFLASSTHHNFIVVFFFLVWALENKMHLFKKQKKNTTNNFLFSVVLRYLVVRISTTYIIPSHNKSNFHQSWNTVLSRRNVVWHCSHFATR